MNELTKLAQHLKREIAKTINTSIPAQVISFDPITQLAQCQIMIKSIDIHGNYFEQPPITEVHILQVGDKDFYIETQIKKGTEGFLCFSQRCFEDWRDTGLLSGQSVVRFHDISDAYFIAGIRSKPNAIVNHENNGIRVRNKDATSFMWLKDDGVIHLKSKNFNAYVGNEIKLTDEDALSQIVLNAGNTAQIDIGTLTLNGDLVHNGNTNQTGDTNQTGNINQTGTITASGKISSAVEISAPLISGAQIAAGGLSAQGGNVSIPNSLQVSGKDIGNHSHPAGALLDAEGRPVTGSTANNT